MKRPSRHGCDWTREDDALLAREWGDISGDLLGEKLGRSEIACIRRAHELGLPRASESAGRESIAAIGRRLGLSGWAVCVLLREGGWTVHPLAPATQSTRRRRPKRGADPSVAEVLCTLRTTRACSLRQWDMERGAEGTAVRLLAAAGLPRPPGRGHMLRVPTALLDELAAGHGGPWTDLWRRVNAASPRPCAAWLLALAAHNIQCADAKGAELGEWTRWAVPPSVLHLARCIVGAATGPEAVRCDDRRAEERAA